MTLPIAKVKDWIAFLGIFTTGFGSLNGLFPFSISQIFVILLFIVCLSDLLLKKELMINKFLLYLFIIIFISSFIINFNYLDSQNIKMFFGFIVYSLAYYWYIKSINGSLIPLMKIYVNICFCFSIIGVVQEIGYLLNLSFLYNLTYLGITINNIDKTGFFLRVYSLTSEPSHLAYFLLPSIFLIFKNFIRKDKNSVSISLKKSIIILLSFLFTFSFFGYFLLFVSVLYLIFNAKKNFIKKFTILMLCITISFISILNIPNIKSKASSMFVKKEQLTSTNNLSSFALISNFMVAEESFKNNILWGTGINTHRFSYDQYIHKLFPGGILMKLNNTGDSSLYSRIPSEFGIAGILITLIILFKFKVRKSEVNSYSEMQCMNDMAFIFLFFGSMRNGNYLDPLVWFFLSLYMNSYTKRYYYND